jgi:protein-L-isoaspartate(D-aspartate) O-methyltransferase
MKRDTAMVVSLVLGVISCATCRAEKATTAPSGDEARFARERAAMVKEQLAGRDITNPRVLETMGRVPRHRFVLEKWEAAAYDDRALPIRHGQTISQPYIVALMTQLADPKPGDRVLDIGTGSGYQAAVLADMGAKVASIEIIPELADEARTRLAELKYDDRVEVRAGDGYRGWPEKAPFHAIILAAAAPQLPKPLIEQLTPGGRLVIPVDAEGAGHQNLMLVTKQPDGTLRRETIAPVAFVPMTGEVRKPAP